MKGALFGIMANHLNFPLTKWSNRAIIIYRVGSKFYKDSIPNAINYSMLKTAPKNSLSAAADTVIFGSEQSFISSWYQL